MLLIKELAVTVVDIGIDGIESGRMGQKQYEGCVRCLVYLVRGNTWERHCRELFM